MSFFSLLKRSKTTREPPIAGKDAAEKPSKTSKRDFLRGLLKRDSTSRKNSSETEWQGAPGPSKSPSLDSNKPLHPAPPTDIADGAPQEQTAEQASAPSPPQKATSKATKLLSEENIQKLFSGAPQFSLLKPSEGADEEERFIPRPQVTFPWDFDLRIRELSDCVRLQHSAFSLATARPHLPLADGLSDDDAYGGVQPRYNIGAVEVPSMLAAQGLEPGTIGYEHFLTLPIADALEEVEDEGIASRDEGDEDDSAGWRRRKFIREGPEGGMKIGVRSIEVSLIIGRLKELGELYHGSATRDGFKTVSLLKEQSSVELYTQLFTRLLYPPNHVHSADTDDPYSLKVQIEALVKVLGVAWIWHDFSIVERRIRLGQMLFGEEGVVDAFTTEAGAERKWLLLQILLASELLVRLDSAVGVGGDEGLEVTPKEIEHFNKLRRKKIDWDLILAQRWLENVRLVEKESPAKINLASPAPAPKSWGWFSSGPTDAPADQQPAQQEVEYDATILPRRQSRQLSGLILFAKILGWPNVESLAADLLEKMQIPSALGTPAGTPLSITSARSGYFPPPSNSQLGRGKRRAWDGSRPQSCAELLRHHFSGPIRSSALMRTVGAGGWLSRSYFTSLVLPGEALSHLLMSTLLENDISAVERLGFNANLYGGFVYDGASWWSKSCIVGRVLAGFEGSEEVAGWVGRCIAPTGQTDGWVDIRVETCRLGLCQIPRILDKDCIGCLSGAAGEEGPRDGKANSADFTFPVDAVSDLSAIDITAESLVFSEINTGDPTPMDEETEEDSLRTYDASITFRIFHRDQSNAKQEPITSIITQLRYDIQFISAYPCSPPRSAAVISLETPKHQTGHPLHKNYTFIYKPLSTLVSNDDDSPLPESKGAIWVVDACESKDKEVFVRAWCARRGLSALVSRIGRTCLACSVREASALDVGVVMRI